MTCPAGRTFLDGVCVGEAVADYVACVRAQGAQLGADKSQKLSAEAGTLGVRASGAAELSESLQKKYSASDAAMLAIIDACSARVDVRPTARAQDQELFARWSFDETAGSTVADSSGHGNTGAVQGPALWTSGRIGGAMKFDASQEVLVDESQWQHAPAITVAGWFLLSEKKASNPWRVIVLKSDPKGGNWWGCADGKDANECDGREYGVALNADERYLSIDAVTEDRFGSGGHSWCNTPPGSVQYGRWHHFGAVMSPKSRSLRAYLDGRLVLTCPLSEAGFHRTSHGLHVGSGMTGMLDDVRVYGTELSDDAISSMAR